MFIDVLEQHLASDTESEMSTQRLMLVLLQRHDGECLVLVDLPAPSSRDPNASDRSTRRWNPDRLSGHRRQK